MGQEPYDIGNEELASLDVWQSDNMDTNDDREIMRPRASSAIETSR